MLSYGKLCTLFYEADNKQFPPGAMETYRRLLGEADGPVLEAMCGSGRFLVPFVLEGFDIDGVDASPSMIARAREKCADAGIDPTMVEAPLDVMKMPRRYSLILVVACSISLIQDKDELSRILVNFHDHLLPGGKLFLEVLTPKGAMTNNNRVYGRWVDLSYDRRILLTIVSEYDAALKTSRMIDKYELFEGAKLIETELEIIDQRYWEPEEIEHELADAGFGTTAIFKAFTAERASSDNPLVVVEAIRPAARDDLTS